MGRAKQQMLEMEEMVQQAVQVLVDTGAAERCYIHEEIYWLTGDDEAERHAYARGTIIANDGGVSGTREEFMTAIKRAIDEAADMCHMCDKAMRD